MARLVPYLNGIGVADHAYATLRASAKADAIVYPRGLGVIPKEVSLLPELQLTVRCWSIFNSIASKELRMQQIIDRFTAYTTYTVIVSGNTYYNCVLTDFDDDTNDKLWAHYSFKFLLNSQGISTINANLKDGAGTAATFQVAATQKLGVTVRPGGKFTFWAHLFSGRAGSWNTQDQTAYGYYITPMGGGTTKISIQGWVIGPDGGNARKNLELYFLSMGRDAVGRTGTLTVSGNTYNYCIFTDFSMGEEDSKIVQFTANFITSNRIYSA